MNRFCASPAEELDPYTDIPGLDITVKVGPLSEEKKSMAVSKALRRAEELVRRKLILGAFVAVQGKYEMTQYFRDRLRGKAVADFQLRFADRAAGCRLPVVRSLLSHVAC